MDKYRIVSDISIEFGLSQEQSEIIVSSIFDSISQVIKKNKDLEIQKFGKFKLMIEKGSEEYKIKFTPSKKLSIRVNSNFENLKKVKLKANELIPIDHGAEFRILEKPDEAKSDIPPIIVIDSIPEDTDDIIITEVPRKLISEDVIKLHNEITNEEKDEASEANLWG